MAFANNKNCTHANHILLFKEGHELVLKEVYDRYWHLLYKSAYNLISDEDAAKDIVQELFISLWGKKEEREINNLKFSLLKALKLQSFMFLRKRYTSKTHLDRIKLISSQMESSTERAINFSQTEEQLQTALQLLPARCREAFQLSRFEHFTNEQISIRMGISVKTVENQMTKALKLIRAALKHLAIVIATMI